MSAPPGPDRERPAFLPCEEILLAEWTRPRNLPPDDPVCVECGVALAEPFGWCAGCRKAFCFGCGRKHFCKPSCPANGCQAGLCVREFADGRLSDRWGLPPE